MAYAYRTNCFFAGTFLIQRKEKGLKRQVVMLWKPAQVYDSDTVCSFFFLIR